MYSEVETHVTVSSNCSWLTFIGSLLGSWHYFECFTCISSFMPLPHFTVEGHRGQSHVTTGVYLALITFYYWYAWLPHQLVLQRQGQCLVQLCTFGAQQVPLGRLQGSSSICSPGKSSVNTVVLLPK